MCIPQAKPDFMYVCVWTGLKVTSPCFDFTTTTSSVLNDVRCVVGLCCSDLSKIYLGPAPCKEMLQDFKSYSLLAVSVKI